MCRPVPQSVALEPPHMNDFSTTHRHHDFRHFINTAMDQQHPVLLPVGSWRGTLLDALRHPCCRDYLICWCDDDLRATRVLDILKTLPLTECSVETQASALSVATVAALVLGRFYDAHRYTAAAMHIAPQDRMVRLVWDVYEDDVPVHVLVEAVSARLLITAVAEWIS
jgi:hypothetical protein